MNNYSRNKLHDPHDFEEEVKTKYDAVKVVVQKFPNGTGPMIGLLGIERSGHPITFLKRAQDQNLNIKTKQGTSLNKLLLKS